MNWPTTILSDTGKLSTGADAYICVASTWLQPMPAATNGWSVLYAQQPDDCLATASVSHTSPCVSQHCLSSNQKRKGDCVGALRPSRKHHHLLVVFAPCVCCSLPPGAYFLNAAAPCLLPKLHQQTLVRPQPGVVWVLLPPIAAVEVCRSACLFQNSSTLQLHPACAEEHQCSLPIDIVVCRNANI